MQFAFRLEHFVFATARPVILEIIAFALAYCFTSLRILTGGRPMAAPTGAGFWSVLSFRQWLFTDYLNYYRSGARNSDKRHSQRELTVCQDRASLVRVLGAGAIRFNA